MLFPIGHDQSIRRIPWVTIALMAICTLVQIHRTFFAPNVYQLQDAASAVEKAEAALRVRIETASMQSTAAPLTFDEAGNPVAAPAPIATAAIPGSEGMSEEQIVEAVHAGTLGDDGDPQIKAVHDADDAMRALLGRDLALKMAFHPDRPFSINAILCAFAHGGWLHLAGNLIFLWLCGCNLEDRWGHVVFGVFYLAAATAASGAYAIMHAKDAVPAVGASGAIAGAMSAFLVCYATARIQWAYVRILRMRVTKFQTPAYVAFPAWFLLQAAQLTLEAQGHAGVGFSAHVGGFLFGAALAGLLRLSGVDAWLMRRAAAEVEGGWEEDAKFLEAEALVATDPDRAIATLRRVLQEKPDHAGAHLALARAAIAKQDAPLVAETYAPAVARLSRDDRWSDIVDLTQEADRIHAPIEADERTSYAVVRAHAELGDAKGTIAAAKKLQAKYPKSTSMPRVLAYVAEAQTKAGRGDLAEATWRRLLSEHPDHALAGKARERIGA